MTSDFKDDRDIKRQIRAIYSKGNILISKFRKCSNEIKVQLFKSLCSNVYSSHLWSNFSKGVFRKLQVAYNNIFRSLMQISHRSSISRAFIEHNVDSFNVLVRKNITNFIKRINWIDNVLVCCCVSRHYFVYGKLNSMWHYFAYS